MTNLTVLKLTIKNITEILAKRWDDIESAQREVDKIVESFKDEINDNNIFNVVVTLEDLI